MKTYYASYQRSPEEQIMSAHYSLKSVELISLLSEATNTMFMILNENRQVVYANKELLTLFQAEESALLSKRPGEILECVNAKEAPAGCGTHSFCRQCGAGNAILAAQKGETTRRDCRIQAQKDDTYFAWDLDVKATPYKYNGSSYVLFSVKDISDTKRKEVLERTFFHDIINTASGMVGFSEILKDELHEIDSEYCETANTIYELSDRLIKEIKNQRHLLAAERKQLEIEVTDIPLTGFLYGIVGSFKQYKNKKNYRLRVEGEEEMLVSTDKVLLGRVLVNMIKNAIEACQENGEVTIRADQADRKIVFSVHNPGYIPEEVRQQIFQRSFSTKGKDRGIGTYSMKLFGENYLRGKVWFESTESKGTAFFLEIPQFLS